MIAPSRYGASTNECVKSSPRVTPSLLAHADDYDLYLVDLWGVTHNGQEPFAAAIAYYATLKAMGKTLVILSNAPRLAGITRARLAEMGIDEENLFDDVCTSGLECHLALANRPDSFYQSLGKRFMHIGPDRDSTLYEGLPYEKVETIERADFLLITGTVGWETSVDGYRAILKKAHERQLPVVCPNADQWVQNGDKLVVCAGALALAYVDLYVEAGIEHIQAPVRIHGKPHVNVYEMAHAMGNRIRGHMIPKSRILMLGDSLGTDIRGANAYGIDSAFTVLGVHTGETLKSLNKLMDSYKAWPTYLMEDGIR